MINDYTACAIAKMVTASKGKFITPSLLELQQEGNLVFLSGVTLLSPSSLPFLPTPLPRAGRLQPIGTPPIPPSRAPFAPPSVRTVVWN